VPFRLLTGKALDEKRTEIVATLNEPDASGKSELIWPLQGGNAYEKVLLDAIQGDQTIFASSQEILASWRILEPVIDAWQKSADDLKFYEPGSNGPS
jgi:glucose-6-phosphate 1-dehydrogenase